MCVLHSNAKINFAKSTIAHRVFGANVKNAINKITNLQLSTQLLSSYCMQKNIVTIEESLMMIIFLN